MDARLPVSQNMTEDDPNHPKNVVKNIMIVQNQTAADTKYDVAVQRIDGFTTQKKEYIRFVAAIIAILVGITIAMKSRTMFVRLGLLMVITDCP